MDTNSFTYRLLEVYTFDSMAFAIPVPTLTGFEFVPQPAYLVKYRGMTIEFHDPIVMGQYITQKSRAGAIISVNHYCDHAEIPVN